MLKFNKLKLSCKEARRYFILPIGFAWLILFPSYFKGVEEGLTLAQGYYQDLVSTHPEILEPHHYYPYQYDSYEQPRHLPYYQTPRQGYAPSYRSPQSPMQLQHRDWLMTHPQPQTNPTGPNIYPRSNR